MEFKLQLFGGRGSNSDIKPLMPWTQGYTLYGSYIASDNSSTEVYFDMKSRGIAFGNGEAPQTPFMETALDSSFNTPADIEKELQRRYPNKQVYIIER